MNWAQSPRRKRLATRRAGWPRNIRSSSSTPLLTQPDQGSHRLSALRIWPLLPCGVPKYRISQAAELVGVSADTVRRRAVAGRLFAKHAAGGMRYVDGADL